MAQRRDLYSECNVDGAPVDVFTAECCIRCVSPECTRSSKGGKFELRVSTWEDRLFRNPPQMNPSDPRYARIANQRFVGIDAGPVPEVRSTGWVSTATPNESAPVPAPLPQPKPAPRRLVLANAPDQTGKVLGQAPKQSPGPWESTAPQKADEKIVSPGATVKFGVKL